MVFFESAADWRAWLEAHHATATELWMGLRKRHVRPQGLRYEDAVPEALCFGWIDSVVHSMGTDARRLRWTPRKPGSVWSSVNLAHVERLEAAGLMRPAGRAAYELRREDRQGIYAYEQAETGELPPAYAALLTADPRAAAFWELATAGYRKQCIHWVLTAKQEATRDRRMAVLVACCAACEAIPYLRYGDPPAWIVRARRTLGGSG